MIAAFEGSFSNVIGLPMERLRVALREFGIS
jgi:predicted house-cleaning NTP pyrophosphatase (Maf/HAM1 superfamily)